MILFNQKKRTVTEPYFLCCIFYCLTVFFIIFLFLFFDNELHNFHIDEIRTKEIVLRIWCNWLRSIGLFTFQSWNIGKHIIILWTLDRLTKRDNFFLYFACSLMQLFISQSFVQTAIYILGFGKVHNLLNLICLWIRKRILSGKQRL